MNGMSDASSCAASNTNGRTNVDPARRHACAGSDDGSSAITDGVQHVRAEQIDREIEISGGGGKLSCTGAPAANIAKKQTLNDACETGIDPRRVRLQRLGVCVQRISQRVAIGCDERQLCSQRLVQDDAQGPEVGCGGCVEYVVDVFRCHVRVAASIEARSRVDGIAHCFAQSEPGHTCDDDVSRLVQEDFLRSE